MPRVKRSVHARKKRRKVLSQAKGYWGLKKSSYRYAKEQVEHSLAYAYRDRKNKKRTFRRLWIMRINAGARANGLSYNQFIAGMKAARIELVELLVAGENVEPRRLASVSALAHPPRVIGIFRRDALHHSLPRQGPGLGLWQVADPGNVGTLIRSVDALGGAYLALSDG